jgi:hypothetical protein
MYIYRFSTNVRGQVDADIGATKANLLLRGPQKVVGRILYVAFPFGATVTNGLQPTYFHFCLVLGSLHEFYSRVSSFLPHSGM